MRCWGAMTLAAGIAAAACGEAPVELAETSDEVGAVTPAYTYVSASMEAEGQTLLTLESDNVATPGGGANIFAQTTFDACQEWFSDYASIRADRAATLEPVVIQDLIDALENKVHWFALCGVPPIGSARAQMWPSTTAQASGGGDVADDDDEPCGLSEPVTSGDVVEPTEPSELMCTVEQVTAFNSSRCKAEAGKNIIGGHAFVCKGKCFPDYDSDYWGPALRCHPNGTTASECNCFFNAAGRDGKPMTDLPPQMCPSKPTCGGHCTDYEVVVNTHRTGNRVLEIARLIEIKVNCVDKDLTIPKCDCLTAKEISDLRRALYERFERMR